MPLIEKAWAKCHEGYENMNRGRSADCLRDLTGAPAFVYEIKNDIKNNGRWMISQRIEKAV